MDEQTFMGKGVGELVALCRSARVPCLALNGSSKLTRSFPEGIGSLHSMIDLTSLRRASAQPRLWLEKLAAQVAHDWPQQLRFERGEQRLGPQ